VKTKSLLKNERGAVLIIELCVLAVVLVAAGFAGYNYYQNQKTASPSVSPLPASAPSPSPAASTTAAAFYRYAIAIAAADRFCDTDPNKRADARADGAGDSRLVFKALSIGPDKKQALYSSDGRFVLLSGICVVADTGATAGGDGAHVVKLTGTSGEVVDMTQEGFHPDKVQLHGIPDYADFK
jgi:hypothetical protein